MYSRHVLVFDAEEGLLADPALQLAAARFNVLYANHLDELLLLSREYRERAGAVIAPIPLLLDELPALLKRLVFPIGLPAAAVVPIGELPEEKVAASFRVQGLRWAIRNPARSADVCLGVRLALQSNDPSDPRRDFRVPCSRPVVLEAGGRELAAVVRDLSTRGAFLVFGNALKPGQPVVLRLRLPAGGLRIPGHVAWKRGRGERGDEGIGIQFDPLDDGALTAISRLVEARIDAFRL